MHDQPADYHGQAGLLFKTLCLSKKRQEMFWEKKKKVVQKLLIRAKVMSWQHALLFLDEHESTRCVSP